MKSIKYLLVAIFSSVVLVACGGKEEKKKEGFSYEKKTDVVKETKSNPNDVTITGNDAMQFNKKEIRVKAGEKVKITLKHIGKMDKNVMGHNFVLLKKGVDVMAFGNKAATAKATNYIPENGKDVIAHTDLVGAGETTVVEFDAPEAGTYDFLCSFPGHYALMKGKLIVE
ncbi:azurin [Algibacter amylolyticus]|uniref:Azurin n=2 Tax=Algibacter TaxID=261827 RepID=A0A1I1PTS1_9FLAO|nr:MULTISPECIES: azurin [Algibacter]KAA5826377.1 azurin [Algibacter amylolyticus]MBB5268583.1 azurin [Algibacter amylolyticus]TSJ80415.1 azurin [Algibacter amylolyticus]SFD10998.1 azurin [Algibacter pectinivorans]